MSGLLWVTWRRHRGVLLFTTACVLAAIGLTAWLSASLTTDDHPLGVLDISRLMAGETAALLGAFIAVFWAAPLVSREFEQRTHQLVWTQDVSPARWLITQVVLLGAVAVALAVAVGVAARSMDGALRSALPEGWFPGFGHSSFESAPVMQVGYAVFGLALGVAAGALVRRTVFAMGVTLAAFIAVRGVVQEFRPYLVPMERMITPLGRWEVEEPASPIRGGWVLESQLVDANGEPMAMPPSGCSGDLAECVRAHGGSGFDTRFHPAGHEVPLQLVEFGIFAVLAGVLLAVALRAVRR